MRDDAKHSHDCQPDPHGGGHFCPLCQAREAAWNALQSRHIQDQWIGVEDTKRIRQLHEEIRDALTLLDPARPEDGLLPAIRDMMQQLTTEREGGKVALEECCRWEGWVRILLHAYDTDNRPNECQLADIRHALAMAGKEPYRGRGTGGK
jgi:hypothetical protein